MKRGAYARVGGPAAFGPLKDCNSRGLSTCSESGTSAYNQARSALPLAITKGPDRRSSVFRPRFADCRHNFPCLFPDQPDILRDSICGKSMSVRGLYQGKPAKNLAVP